MSARAGIFYPFLWRARGSFGLADHPADGPVAGDRLGRDPRACRRSLRTPLLRVVRPPVRHRPRRGGEAGRRTTAGLQEFFTRRCAPGARPIAAAPDVVVSPADGTVVECGHRPCRACSSTPRTRASPLADLLADERRRRAAWTAGRTASPICRRATTTACTRRSTGRWSPGTTCPGRLFPVNARSVAARAGSVQQERAPGDPDRRGGRAWRGGHGGRGRGRATSPPATIPEVATHGDRFGATCRRRQSAATAGARSQRGQELGIFNLGSTTIVVFEPNRVVLDPLAPGATVRMGAAHRADASNRV